MNPHVPLLAALLADFFVSTPLVEVQYLNLEEPSKIALKLQRQSEVLLLIRRIVSGG
jgi:hypothetical protein